MKKLLIGLAMLGVAWAEPQPITYEEAVKMGLDRNLGLQSVSQEVPAAQARLEQALAARNPNLV